MAEIIGNLKSKTITGIDNISSKLPRKTKDSITESLTIIVNQMLKTGTFPKFLKSYLYIKKGTTQICLTIDLSPSFNQFQHIFEKAVLIQLTEYLENSNIIHPHQYGFRKFHSTEYAALHLTDYINYKKDIGKTPVNLYLYFSKAFDTLVHSILLHKHYGIDGLAYKLIESYLENRKQYVELNSERSDIKSIKNRVPQGNILGLLLFLIYINDLPNASHVFDCLMYADDTTLFCCLEDIKSINKQGVINEELQRIHDWLIANEFKSNTTKSKYIMFRKQNKNIPSFNIHINNVNIESVQNFNFLVLHLSSDMTWNFQINEVSKKISRNIGILKKLQLIVPNNILLTI